MNQFVEAFESVPVVARTENGMRTQESSLNACLDLFFKAGASRGVDITVDFARAIAENQDIALRIAQWTRDVRGGAGERETFRSMLRYLESHYRAVLLETTLLENVPNIGRWDDLLIFRDSDVKRRAYSLIREALFDAQNPNGLCAKWMPRKGPISVELRNFMGLSPKSYRKLLVRLTDVVETAMCNKDYANINYSHVPSLAMSRYMRAFGRNDSLRFISYQQSLVKGEDGVKINASAVYPYDIIKSLRNGGDLGVNDAQWKALPDYMNDALVLPIVDVSGSMDILNVSGNITAMDVAISLGLYCADKNKGAFKDMFMTFSSRPKLLRLAGTLSQKLSQMEKSEWGMNTNLHAAFDALLRTAVAGKVPGKDMPKILLILSDMQFDQCSSYDDNAIGMIRRKYEEAGYTVPNVVFWNLGIGRKGVPVSFNESGVCLVSGFSPAIMKSVLSAEIEPMKMLLATVCTDRYNIEKINA